MTEEMLTQMIKSACELEYEEIEKRIKTEYPHIFSDEFNQKMDCLVMMEEDDGREQLDPDHPIHFRIRYVLVAVLLLVLGTSTVFGDTFFSEKIKDFVYKVFPQYIMIESDRAEGVSELSVDRWKSPSYIPERFSIVNEEKNEETGLHTMMWSDSENHTLSYMQAGLNMTMAVTSNGEKPKEVMIGSTVGKLSIDGEGNRSLFFEKDEEVFTIVGSVSEEEIIKIAESIQ